MKISMLNIENINAKYWKCQCLILKILAEKQQTSSTTSSQYSTI